MFSKKHRLSGEKNVRLAITRGRAFFNAYFSIKFLKKPDYPQARFTVVVSTKFSKKAVKRNRAKRHLREFLKKNIRRILSGDYVIYLKPAATSLAEPHREMELSKLLEAKNLFL